MESGGNGELDLTPILRNLAGQRGTPEAQKRLANDPTTRLFLDAGVTVLSSHAGTISGPLVLKEAARLDKERRTYLAPNDAKFRDRWPFIKKFQADLLSFCLAQYHWSLHLTDESRITKELAEPASFYDAVQNVSYHDLSHKLDQGVSRAAVLASLAAGNDPESSQAIRETNLELRAKWESVCTQVYGQRGMRLRPGSAFEQLADLLVILADGIAFRALPDKDSGLIDRDRRASLFGVGAAALFAGLADQGDGKSLKQVLDDLG